LKFGPGVIFSYVNGMKSSADAAPTPERILDAAESLLRRHGAEKTNVVDVARMLGMSHGNIYRHFPSKKALLDAVAVRWLNVVTAPLEAIACDRSRPAAARLKSWFDHLRAAKLKKVRGDPELFRVHYKYVQALREVSDEHVTNLLGQVERIIADGITTKEFSPKLNTTAAARAFLQATSRFHHPALVMLDPPPRDADARAVFGLLLAGLRTGGI
jgi:AcrR family transcriptional regulator